MVKSVRHYMLNQFCDNPSCRNAAMQLADSKVYKVSDRERAHRISLREVVDVSGALENVQESSVNC